MSALAAGLLVAAGVAAAVNWIGVARDDRRLVYGAKPATLVLLIAVAAALDAEEPAVKAWFLAGLVLSLAGDVFLMLPEGRRYPVDPFRLGLGSFLVGHLAYIVGLASDHRSWVFTGLGAAIVLGAVAVIGPRVVAGVGRASPEMRLPVLVYMAVISLMVVAAFGRTVPVGIAGALLFYVSDSTLAWNRFIAPSRAARIAVMVTYHLAQAGLVLSLLG